ncbi:bactofilin family protein [Modicisalibacter radicis]|uniref:bactofilin family protein n=1 Tax=Halomonas sp. EAR18 TaxID=2518972 RepID=UPI00109C1EF8|nr:polymer-forming cytoskeletal protein [Halomonas sp. EAR18]
MGGGDVLFTLGVVALIVILLDGRRRIGKRAPAPRPRAAHTAETRAVTPREPSESPARTGDRAPVPLPAAPVAAITHELSARPESRIGPSLRIEGKVHSREALVIHGAVEGSVTADKHSVTVSASGRVSQCIEARVISVAGSVTGSLVAGDQALLLSSARVEGRIDAKRLKCEAGAWLKAACSVTSRQA